MSIHAAATAEPTGICLYPRPHPNGEEWQALARKKSDERPGFGARLAQLRKPAGYTQQELAQELGVSRRMVAYYEGETEHPPAALRVTTDELLGATPLRRRAAKTDSRLARRMQQIEQMNPKEKRQVLQILDAPLEREQLRASKG
jgi:transcriptional regulator with XRE-family HTH domain